MQRLIDRDKIWDLFVGHYWDSLQKDRDIILCHINEILLMTPEETNAQPGQPSV